MARPVGGAGYATDFETASKVTDGAVELISEGHWKMFTRE
jgi:dipeptidase E